jgi:hypothetical protein
MVVVPHGCPAPLECLALQVGMVRTDDLPCIPDWDTDYGEALLAPYSIPSCARSSLNHGSRCPSSLFPVCRTM